MQHRYVGEPSLRLLECHIVWAIVELPADEETKLLALTPALRDICKREGSWQQIVTGERENPGSERIQSIVLAFAVGLRWIVGVARPLRGEDADAPVAGSRTCREGRH